MRAQILKAMALVVAAAAIGGCGNGTEERRMSAPSPAVAPSMTGKANCEMLPEAYTPPELPASYPMFKETRFVDHRTYTATGGEIVGAKRKAIVYAKYGSVVTARDGSTVYAEQGSWVYASEGSRIYAQAGSVVAAYERAWVQAEDGSLVVGFAGAEIQAESGSYVIARGASVTANKGASVVADSGSKVTSNNGSVILAQGGSETWAKEGGFVYATAGSVVYAYEGSAAYAYNNAKVYQYPGASVHSCGTAEVIQATKDVRVIGPHSRILIHEVSSGTRGKVSEMEDDIKFSRELWKQLSAILAKRSKMTATAIQAKALKFDWWLGAKEAIKLGFADKIG